MNIYRKIDVICEDDKEIIVYTSDCENLGLRELSLERLVEIYNEYEKNNRSCED